MWFLIKSAFWFAIVLMLLPLARPAARAGAEPGQKVSIGATVAAATSALDDLTGICGRRPQVCRTGGEALSALGARVRDGALVAYGLLDERFGTKARDGAAAGTPAASSGSPRPGAAVRAAAVPVPAPAPAPAAAPATLAAEAYLPRPYLPPEP